MTVHFTPDTPENRKRLWDLIRSQQKPKNKKKAKKKPKPKKRKVILFFGYNTAKG